MVTAVLRVVFCLALGLAALTAFALSSRWPLYWAVPIGVLAPLLVHALILCSGFFLADRAQRQADLAAAVALPWPRYLLCMWQELLVSWWHFLWVQPWRSQAALYGTQRNNDGPAPVLLLHGYFCTQALWRGLSKQLDAQGHAVAALDMVPALASIDHYADAIETAVQALRQRTGAARVALVCHSMGGLAARAYLRRYGDAAIAHVITLATPHQGTFSGPYGLGENARQMGLHSPWLTALAASENPALYQKFTVIFSHQDNVVAPRSMQSLPGARMIGLSGYGHMRLVYAPKVQAIVCAVLAGRC